MKGFPDSITVGRVKPTDPKEWEHEDRQGRKGRVLAQIDILTQVPVSKVHALNTTGLLEIEIIAVSDY